MQPTNNNYRVLRTKEVTHENLSFMNRVYLWMTAGILISGVTAYVIASNANLVMALAQNSLLFFGLMIFQLVAVVALSAWVQRMSIMMASTVYALYATLVGVTFSVISLAYTTQSISLAFFSTSIAFAGLSGYGYVTKRDLGPIGAFCIMGLFGMIAVVVLGMFIPSMMTNSMQMTISVIGILVFSGLTAYDTQKIKALQDQFSTVEETRKGAIYGALILYLDFINLFLSILRLMGNRR